MDKKRELTIKEVCEISSILDLFPPSKPGEESIEVEIGYFKANFIGSPRMVLVGGGKKRGKT